MFIDIKKSIVGMFDMLNDSIICLRSWDERFFVLLFKRYQRTMKKYFGIVLDDSNAILQNRIRGLYLIHSNPASRWELFVTLWIFKQWKSRGTEVLRY